jgi:hypothetical protein
VLTSCQPHITTLSHTGHENTTFTTRRSNTNVSLTGTICDANDKVIKTIKTTGNAFQCWAYLMGKLYGEKGAFNMVLGCLLAGEHTVKSDGTFVEFVVEGECWRQSVVNE